MPDSDAHFSFITATHWGIVRGAVENNRIVALKPFEFDRSPSPNLEAFLKLRTSQARIRTPLVREGFLKNGPASRDDRGRDRFLPVDWETALNLAACETARVYDTHGPASVFARSYGWKSSGSVNASVTLVRRLANLLGGFVPTLNSYSTGCIAAILPYVTGFSDPPCPDWDDVLAHAERVVFWGADPLVTNDVDWCTTLHEGREKLFELKNRSIETIVVNPMRTETGRMLGSRWIAVRPGSDTAMMAAMIHVLVTENLADTEFLNDCTSGFEALKAYILGASDGTPKTPAWAQGICGVAADEIACLARELKSRRTMLMMGWGPQRARYGEQPPFMAWALACCLGHVGRSGGGIGTHYHYSDGGVTACPAPLIGEISSRVTPMRISSAPQTLPAVMPVARFAECFLHPGQTYRHLGQKKTFADVRLVLWAGGNPFSHQPDTARLVEAFRKPEAVVVCDTVMTATARHADIVLPATHGFERNDIAGIGSYTHRGVVAMQQAVPALELARDDFDIWADLADRLGVGRAFTEGLDQEGWRRRLYGDFRLQALERGLRTPEYDAFWDKGFVLFEARKSPDFWQAYREDPQGHALKTASGRIALMSPELEAMNCRDCPPTPAWIADDEPRSLRSGQPLPLVLITIKSRRRLHSQLDSEAEKPTTDGRRLEPCRMHPEDARARGIVDGDLVRLFNDRGGTLACAVLTEDVMPGVVVLEHGSWYDPDPQNPKRDGAGAGNMLMRDVPASEFSGGNIASGARVDVRRCAAESARRTARRFACKFSSQLAAQPKQSCLR